MGTNDEQGSAVTISEDGNTLTRVGVVPTSGGYDTMTVATGKSQDQVRYVALSCPGDADPIVIDEYHWGMFLELITRSTGLLPSVMIPRQAERTA